MQQDRDIATLRQMIAEAQRVVVFTGAGISTESGIPDFRSPGGIWTRQKPIEFGDFIASEEARCEAWRRRFESDAQWQDRIIELHGNATYAHCLDCATRYEIEALRTAFEREAIAPRCPPCGGLIKTATISFGQAMPATEMQEAQAETLAADLFIAIGSSLVVYPAAGFPELAKRNGAALVIINREPTGLDPMADLVLNRTIGQTLGDALDIA